MPILSWIILAVSLGILVWGCGLRNNFGISMGGLGLALFGGIAALCIVIWMVSLHYERATCHAWAKQTGRETKFAYYNPMSWDCLTKASDGKWVPKEQIGDYNK